MKKKLIKFEELHHLGNVFQKLQYDNPKLLHLAEERDMAGQWAGHFGNANPLVLELACGRGEYSRAIAKDYPKNCIGIDLKGNRLWHGAKMALREGLPNVAYIRSRIEFISGFFAPDELDEIWVLFADPQPAKPRKRLCSTQFLAIYRQILKPGGILHLKTDSDLLFDSSVESILAEPEHWELRFLDRDIYAGHPLHTPELQYKTHYEGLHLADKRTIKYLRAIRKP